MKLNNPLCLAPLAGVTTLPVRELFARLGVAVTHTEMISCAGLIRNNEKTFDMLRTSGNEAELIVQLFANDLSVLISGAEVVMNKCENFSGFGINMACPMPKITRNGSGAALLKKPELAFAMTRELKKFNLPVWVKIRKLENDKDTLKIISGLAKAGADNICVHGRTPSQRYEGTADRKILKLAAEKFPGLISASGDVKTLSDINEYLSFGCVAVMLARGIIANPFLCDEFFGVTRSDESKLEELFNLAERTLEISGEHKALIILKRFAGSMLRYSHGSAEKRNLAMTSTTLSEIKRILHGG